MLPPSTASSAVAVGGVDQAWPVPRVADVIDELADHDQVVLYLQAWQVRASGTFWLAHDTLDRELDWDAPWPQLVQDARELALLEAAFLPHGNDVVVTVEWIAEADR